MKKVIGLVAALMMVLMGCSGTTENWPKKITLEDYIVTRNDKAFKGEYHQAFSSYLTVSEEQIVDESALIAKVEIIEEPVEYELNDKSVKGNYSLMLLAFKAKILKVFNSDTDVKEGQIVKFLRSEFRLTCVEFSRVIDKETINLKYSKEYILFLTRPEVLHPEKSFTDACYSLADYICKDPCRTIIICNDDGSYEFDMNFSSLTGGAENSDSTYGMQMMISKDKEFEANVQKLADSKKVEE